MPFDGECIESLFIKIFEIEPDYSILEKDPEISYKCIDLLKSLFKKSPFERITA